MSRASSVLLTKDDNGVENSDVSEKKRRKLLATCWMAYVYVDVAATDSCRLG